MSSKTKPWGKITWYFIHTFCEKINEPFFMANREKCLAVLTNVCNMIPCPTCRKHASEYMKKNQMTKMIRTKEDLKQYFFKFHNQATLNGNPKSSLPDASVTLDMYKRANFKAIINAFYHEYMKSTPTRQDYGHTFYSQNILRDTIRFVKANQMYFTAAQKIEEPTNIQLIVHEL